MGIRYACEAHNHFVLFCVIMREIVIRIPGQKKDLILSDLDEDLAIDALKEIIHSEHEDKPDPSQQRLIHSGKMLENAQRLSGLNLNSDNQGSAVIHLVVSKAPSPPPVETPVVEELPERVVEATPETPAQQVEPTLTATPTTTTADDDSWQSDELKRYFRTWDLSIKCHQLSAKHRHLVPQLQLFKSLIEAKQKELVTGQVPTTPIDQADLPRQNNDRENAVLGAQGLMEEDIQGDWLDRFYTMIKVGLILMTLYNYNTSDSFLAIILSIFTFMLYQGGFFRLQRRRRRNRDNEQRPAGERPGVLRLMWTFVSRFITSLVPHNPAPVNAN